MSDVSVEVLAEPSEQDIDALSRLLPQVSSSAPTLESERARQVIANPATYVIVARIQGQIAGMAILCVCNTFAGAFGLVEEVAVDTAARGQHVSVLLMVKLLQQAKEMDLNFVDLTSRPSREAANGLYVKLGFELRETNPYRHRLASIPEAW